VCSNKGRSNLNSMSLSKKALQRLIFHKLDLAFALFTNLAH
jgi:hypothetical protein